MNKSIVLFPTVVQEIVWGPSVFPLGGVASLNAQSKFAEDVVDPVNVMEIGSSKQAVSLLKIKLGLTVGIT